MLQIGMKNFFLLFVMIVLSGASVATTGVVAAGPDIGLEAGGLTQKTAEGGGYSAADASDTALSQTVGRIAAIVFSLTGTIFFVLTVVAGVMWMTAGGNDEKLEKARKILSAAVIGLTIALMGYSITFFVNRGIRQSTGAGSASP